MKYLLVMAIFLSSCQILKPKGFEDELEEFIDYEEAFTECNEDRSTLVAIAYTLYEHNLYMQQYCSSTDENPADKISYSK